MKQSLGQLLLVGTLLVFLLALPAAGQVYSIDYLGYGWEQTPTPGKVAGDELIITSVADGVDAAFGVDLGTEEMTLHIYGLISDGPVDMGGYNVTNYSGGIMDIYEDPAMNADWGTFPPNATSPGTFTEGSLFFRGSFTSFTMTFDPSGSFGGFQAYLDGIAGSVINAMCTNCVYTWGGAFTLASGVYVPDGYSLQIDGTFEIDSAVDTETTSWGSVKALFK